MKLLYLEDMPDDQTAMLNVLAQINAPCVTTTTVPSGNTIGIVRPECMTVVDTREQAITAFKEALEKGESFTHAIIDLNLGGSGRTEDVILYEGLDVVEYIREHEDPLRPVTLLIVSGYGEKDLPLKKIKELRVKGRWPNTVLQKPVSADHLKPYFMGVEDKLKRLEDANLMFASSEAMVQLVREVSLWIEYGMESLSRDRQPLPAAVVVGPSGSGKSTFARCVHELIAAELGRPSSQVPFAMINGPQHGDSGDSSGVALFGARGYPRLNDTAGVLERGSVYGTAGNLVLGNARSGARIKPCEPTRAGVSVIDEIDKMTSSSKQRLLTPISERSIETMGDGTLIDIRCFLLATTDVSDVAADQEYNQFFQLYNRMRRFVVPPLWDRKEEWQDMLKYSIRRRFDIDPEDPDNPREPEDQGVLISKSAADLIESFIDEKKFNCRAMQDLAETVACVDDRVVVTLGDVDRLINDKYSGVGLNWQRHQVQHVALLPRSLSVEWTPGDVVGVSEALDSALSKDSSPASSKPSILSVIRCEGQVFDEETRKRYQKDTESWRQGFLRFLLEAEHRKRGLSGERLDLSVVKSKKNPAWRMLSLAMDEVVNESTSLKDNVLYQLHTPKVHELELMHRKKAQNTVQVMPRVRQALIELSDNRRAIKAHLETPAGAGDDVLRQALEWAVALYRDRPES